MQGKVKVSLMSLVAGTASVMCRQSLPPSLCLPSSEQSLDPTRLCTDIAEPGFQVSLNHILNQERGDRLQEGMQVRVTVDNVW